MNKFKKIALTLGIILSVASPVKNARADITDSTLFEPLLLCAAGGAAGAFTAQQGQEILLGSIFCGAGALTGVLINSHYKSKYAHNYEKEIQELRSSIKEAQLQQALKAANSEDETYSIKIRQVVPGQRLPNGEIIAPTIRERLVPPGENIRLGD
jgi:hypothetical protein